MKTGSLKYKVIKIDKKSTWCHQSNNYSDKSVRIRSFSALHFSEFEVDTEIYSANHHIQ